MTGRSPMRSPGAPTHRREVEAAFWRDCEGSVGGGGGGCGRRVAGGRGAVVPTRWRHVTVRLRPAISGRYLSFPEREEIALLKAQGAGVREIARAVGRDPSTISRELRRNAATRGGKLRLPGVGRAVESRPGRAAAEDSETGLNPRLHAYVQQRLSGQICRPDGTVVAGPVTGRGHGRNKPHRGDRPWVRRGARNRSRTGSSWTSPMMSRCASATRRSTRPFTSRARGARSESWSRACEPGGRCARHGPVCAEGVGSRHPGGDDQRAARRGRGPRRAPAIGKGI